MGGDPKETLSECLKYAILNNHNKKKATRWWQNVQTKDFKRTHSRDGGFSRLEKSMNC